MGTIIDAEFGGRNAGDRYCVACHERYPRRSTLCPRCGGALTLWALESARSERRRLSRKSQYRALAALVLFVALLVLSAFLPK
jgi:predicted amidophosphoribosyltransferase